MKYFNKFLCMLIAMSMLLGCFAFTAFAAETVTISVEKAVPGYPVSVMVDGAAVTDQTVTWYVCSTEDGDYTAVDGATGDQWQITNACANKYIKADVDGVKSNAIKVGAGVSTSTSWQHGAASTKPTQYSFRVADSTANTSRYYQMLDSETVDGKKNYLIIQLGESVLNGKICSDSTNTKWDPTLNSSSVKHLAYWLENYWSKGLTTNEVWTGTGASSSVMEEALRAYVPEHTWLTERSAAVTNDYTFKAHATILSIQEVRNYKTKLYKTDIDKMFMRSGHIADTTQKRAYSYINGNNISAIAPQSSMASNKVLPAFYLTEDFFKNVKLDLSVTGTDVKALILEHNNSDEAALRTIGYDTADLVELGVIVGAEFASLKNSSDADVVAGSVTGTTSLTATYTLTNNAAEAKDVSLIIAVYDGDEMVNAGYNKVTATVGESTPNVEVTGLDATKTYKVKIMVWNDMDSITNLCDAMEF